MYPLWTYAMQIATLCISASLVVPEHASSTRQPLGLYLHWLNREEEEVDKFGVSQLCGVSSCLLCGFSG